MKVFLKRDVPGVGKAHEVQKVADGYARNYLFPKKLAVPATPGQIKVAENYARSQQQKQDRVRARSLDIVEQLKTQSLTFKAKAGSTGRLYGSITSADVAQAIGRAIGSKFDKRVILMDRPIRALGEHVVELKLAGGVRGQARVVVEAEA